MKNNALYIHGLGSGKYSTTSGQMAKIIPELNWIPVEVGEDPYVAIEIINRHISRLNPAIVMGTSLGGLYTIYAKAPYAIKIVCNPAINIEALISDKIGYGIYNYFVKRQDGQTQFVLDKTICDRFIEFKNNKSQLPGLVNFAIFSAHDELIGDHDSLDNMAKVFNYGYSILIDTESRHRLHESAIRLIRHTIIPKYFNESQNYV